MTNNLFHRNFQTFDPAAQTLHANSNYSPPNYAGGSTAYLDPVPSYGQSDMNQQKSYIPNEFEDEPPLLEGR